MAEDLQHRHQDQDHHHLQQHHFHQQQEPPPRERQQQQQQHSNNQWHDTTLYDDPTSSLRTPVSPLLPSQQEFFPPLLKTAGHDAHEVNIGDEPLVSPIMSTTASVVAASESHFTATTSSEAINSNDAVATPTSPTTSFHLPVNPANVRPPAAYVAPFGAAQVVSEHQASSLISDTEDDHILSKDEVSFTPSSLALINAFLDQLLFSFLSTARATTLNALRGAVTDILRHKLARDAIASANEELADLLAGGDDEEDEVDTAKRGGNSNDSTWDLDLIWRRTRLRVMVYMRLGEMEDDDEERYVKEQEALGTAGERGRFSSSAGLVSWSAAIFLTSVLEHVAEQTLQVAGTAAFTRYRRREEVAEGETSAAAAAAAAATTTGTASTTATTVLVEDQDVERVALNPALGRLWRSWRKTMRSNARPTTPNVDGVLASSRPSPAKSVSTLRDSFGTAPESAHGEDDGDAQERGMKMLGQYGDISLPIHELASSIRLPLGDPLRDVDEIEVPGLARDPSENGSECPTPTGPRHDRRRSFSTYQSRAAEVKALSDVDLTSDDDVIKPSLQRRRSTSVPAPMRNILAAMLGEHEVATATNGTNKEVMTSDGPRVEQAGVPPRKQTIGDLLLDDAPETGELSDSRHNVEELDKRKSLLDIKSLLASANGGYPNFTGTKDGTDKEHPVPTGSDQSHASHDKESSTAAALECAAESQHTEAAVDEEPAQIGIATTSDRAIVPARTPSVAGSKSPSPPFDTNGNSNNISRASSIGRTKYSPQLSEDAKRAQSESPAGGAEEAPARDRPLEPNAQTLAALRESVQRASSPQIAQQLASSANQSNRKSMTSQFVTPLSAYNSNAQPVEPPATLLKASTPEERKNGSNPNLTSASIRGPQDFDQFVQSDETRKYTLTPDPIRAAPTADADALAQLTGQVPLVVQPTAARQSTAGASVESGLTEAEKKRHRFSVTKPPSRNSSVSRRSGMMAREARVITESTRDFADFIRSTRPDKEPTVRPISTTMSAAALKQSYRNSVNYSLPRTSSLTSTSERSKSLTRSDIAAGFAPPVPSVPTPSVPSKAGSMRPKSATGSSKGNGELIAFIRDGPREDGKPRISRNVAPFRNTLDSDHFDALKGSADLPTRSASTTTAGKRTSVMNGSSNAGSIAHPAYSQGPQMFNPLSSNPANVAPPRKRTRNKDPYAIDLDDDEEEEDISALPKNRRASTIPDSTNDDDKPIASAASLAQAREIRDRARDRGSRHFDGSELVTALPAPAVPKSREARSSAIASRKGGDDNEQMSTSELAEFFRNSEPPSSAAAPAPVIAKSAKPAPTQPAKKEKKRGFFASLFGRSKSTTSTSAGGRHADMP